MMKRRQGDLDAGACSFTIHGSHCRGALQVATSVAAYLFTSVRNRCLNAIRDRKIRDEHNNKLVEAQLFSGTEDVVIDEDVHRRLQEALDSLPDKCREIILLKVVEGKEESKRLPSN